MDATETRTDIAPRPGLRSERGFTLPELLIASVITMIVTGAALTALQDANRANEAAAVMSDVNQNLRVAMNLVIRDLLSTGEGIPTGGIAFPTGVGAAAVQRPGPVGADWEFDETWVTLPAVSPGSGIGPVVSDVATDAVTLLYEDHRLDFSNLTMEAIADDGSSFTVPASLSIDDPNLGIHPGDLIMWTNGKGNTLQEVTSVEGQTVFFATTADSNLNQPDAPDGSVLALRDVDEDTLAITWQPVSIKRITMVTYYLYVPDSGPITSPHLIRRVGYGAERVVAIGVENVQFTWDLVDGVDNPTNIDDPGPTDADPDNLNTEHQIRKANLVMSARSLQTYSRTGQYMRASLATQVSLRSLAFVSRYDLQ